MKEYVPKLREEIKKWEGILQKKNFDIISVNKKTDLPLAELVLNPTPIKGKYFNINTSFYNILQLLFKTQSKVETVNGTQCKVETVNRTQHKKKSKAMKRAKRVITKNPKRQYKLATKQ